MDTASENTSSNIRLTRWCPLVGSGVRLVGLIERNSSGPNCNVQIYDSKSLTHIVKNGRTAVDSNHDCIELVGPPDSTTGRTWLELVNTSVSENLLLPNDDFFAAASVSLSDSWPGNAVASALNRSEGVSGFADTVLMVEQPSDINQSLIGSNASIDDELEADNTSRSSKRDCSVSKMSKLRASMDRKKPTVRRALTEAQEQVTVITSTSKQTKKKKKKTHSEQPKQVRARRRLSSAKLHMQLNSSSSSNASAIVDCNSSDSVKDDATQEGKERPPNLQISDAHHSPTGCSFKTPADRPVSQSVTTVNQSQQGQLLHREYTLRLVGDKLEGDGSPVLPIPFRGSIDLTQLKRTRYGRLSVPVPSKVSGQKLKVNHRTGEIYVNRGDVANEYYREIRMNKRLLSSGKRRKRLSNI